MPYATHGDQTLRAAARDFAYYLSWDLRDPVAEFADFGGGSVPTDRSYFSNRAAGPETDRGSSNPIWRDYVLTQYSLLFVTATFLFGIYFPPVAVVLSWGVKQVTNIP